MRSVKIGTLLSFVFVSLAITTVGIAQGETPEQWYRQGRSAVASAKLRKPIDHKAKNVILFIGDGMGVSTVTAARILEGQLRLPSARRAVRTERKRPQGTGRASGPRDAPHLSLTDRSRRSPLRLAGLTVLVDLVGAALYAARTLSRSVYSQTSYTKLVITEFVITKMTDGGEVRPA